MNEEKRNIILKHYRKPINYGLINDNAYIKVNSNNESCIDNIDMMVKIENEVIKDIRFEAESCSISKSATSIMIETLLNKTITEAIKIYNEYEKMILSKEYNEKILENAYVYSEIKNQPNRKKCALLPWHGIKKILNDIHNI